MHEIIESLMATRQPRLEGVPFDERGRLDKLGVRFVELRQRPRGKGRGCLANGRLDGAREQAVFALRGLVRTARRRCIGDHHIEGCHPSHLPNGSGTSRMAQLGSRCGIERAAELADRKDQSDVGVLCSKALCCPSTAPGWLCRCRGESDIARRAAAGNTSPDSSLGR